MPRALAIDYGLARVGLAISDELKIIANPLETIETAGLMLYLKNNILAQNIDTIVIGYPKDLMNRDTHLTLAVEQLFKQIQTQFPTLHLQLLDERFTSKMAQQTLFQMGLNKKKRQDKKRIDQMSALILLQSFLGDIIPKSV